MIGATPAGATVIVSARMPVLTAFVAPSNTGLVPTVGWCASDGTVVALIARPAGKTNRV